MAQRERIATHPRDRSNRWSVPASEVLSGNRVLTAAEVERHQAFSFDCNGAARNLDLPAEEGQIGAYIFINNLTGATHALTVRNDAAGTVVAIPATKSAMVWCDAGAVWRAFLGA